ncbi:MAG: hypothetical protein IPG85_13975 [Bacteroidetes bacterium]|nr:hypothetical protein [Bacteroidota bacterium]
MQGASTYTNPSVQTLNVTAFASDKLSGNCTVAVSGGTINTLVCTFSNLPKNNTVLKSKSNNLILDSLI